jgi:hypothetical protein
MLDVEPFILAECQAVSECDRFEGLDWIDVLRRTGVRVNRRPAWFRVGLVAAAVLAIAAPAFALRHRVVDFFTASHAPNGVVEDFGRLQASSFPSSSPGILPHQARTVTTVRSGGVTATLSVAPTRAGTYCDLWRIRGGAPITGTGVECLSARGHSPLGTFSYTSLTPQLGIDTLTGSVLRNDVTVRVNYKDGTSAEIDYTWVTKPVQAGFFYYTVPADQKMGRSRPVSVTVSEKGHVRAKASIADPAEMYQVVTYRDSWGEQIQTGSEVVWDKRRLVKTLTAKNGSLVELWVTPSRRGTSRRCIVSNTGIAANACVPTVLEGDPLQLGITSGVATGTTLLSGYVSANVREIKLLFADGSAERVKPRDGLLLIPLPSRSYASGHRLGAAIGEGSDGRAIFRQAFRTDVPNLYPCAKSKSYGYGVRMCP